MAERKNKGGRPTKATAETMNKILDGIKAGMSYEGACGVARVSWVTFDKWRKAGEAGESEKFIGFLRELRYAEAIAEAEMLKKLKEDPDTKWVAWRLERRFPDRWGKKEQVKQEISGPEGKPIQTETKITSVDILKDYPHLFSSNADDTKE
jgi:transposase